MKKEILTIYLLSIAFIGFSQNKKDQIEQLHLRIDSCQIVIASQSNQIINLSDENKIIHAKITKTENDLQGKEKLLNETQNQLLLFNIENKKLKAKLDSISKINEMIYKIDGVKTFQLKESSYFKFAAKQTSNSQLELTFLHESSEECACTESETYVFKINGSNIELVRIYDEEGYDPDKATIKEILSDLRFTFHQTSGYLDYVYIQNTMSGECCQITEGQYIIQK